MTKGKMINDMIGKSIIVDAKWCKGHDEELLDWVTSSKYWGRGYNEEIPAKKAIIELKFDEDGVRYCAAFKGYKDDDCPSRNQPPWGEDSWDDWDYKAIKKYYDEFFDLYDRINELLKESGYEVEWDVDAFISRKEAIKGNKGKILDANEIIRKNEFNIEKFKEKYGYTY
jgi:hypothetical protein